MTAVLKLHNFEPRTLPVFWIKVMSENYEITTTTLKSLLLFPTSHLS